MDNALLQEAARHVLGFHNLEGGWTPGGFTHGLIALWGKADPSNRRRLAGAFPELGHVIATFENGHIEHIRRIARGDYL
jgi:hypothetical protein